jgi:hypothetical protein
MIKAVILDGPDRGTTDLPPISPTIKGREFMATLLADGKIAAETMTHPGDAERETQP